MQNYLLVRGSKYSHAADRLTQAQQGGASSTPAI
jgi:hypothetical protein